MQKARKVHTFWNQQSQVQHCTGCTEQMVLSLDQDFLCNVGFQTGRPNGCSTLMSVSDWCSLSVIGSSSSASLVVWPSDPSAADAVLFPHALSTSSAPRACSLEGFSLSSLSGLLSCSHTHILVTEVVRTLKHLEVIPDLCLVLGEMECEYWEE